MRKQLNKNTIILVSLSLLVGLGFSFLFLRWWKPELREPTLPKEELKKIDVTDSKPGSIWYGQLTIVNPDLKWKEPINVEECKRGDYRRVFYLGLAGLDYQKAVVLARIGRTCVIKRLYREMERPESVYICPIPRSKKEIYIHLSPNQKPLTDTERGGYCRKLPPVFEKI